MFVFKRAPRRSLSDLESFLREVGDQPVEFLTRTFDDWRQISYAELEDLILSGRAADLIDWQSRYAKVVNEKFNPLWLAAIARASYNSTRGKITIDDSDPRVKDFLRTRAAELIRDLSDESRRAIANVILHGQSEHLAPKEIARQIRPLIGLNQRQAQANVNYRQKIFRQLIDNGLSAAQAQIRADKAAVKYASKQHRQRAETIVHTELARAYNQGAHDGVLSAVQEKLMNHCEMVWSTAGTNRVCGRCLSLKDTVVGHTNEQGIQLPPLHPRCRCTISYREMPLTAPSVGGNVGGGNKPLTPEQIKAIRDTEDKAFRTPTGADFGFARMKISPDWSREIMLTNPPSKYGHTPNCQRCVVAHEARMRGFDVVARPSWGTDDALRNTGDWLKAFDYSPANIVKITGKTGEEVIKLATQIMCSFEEGARAIIIFKWGKSAFQPSEGHAIVAQHREKGIVNFGDPQTRKIAAAKILRMADLKSDIFLVRVDKLKLTEIVKRCAMPKE